MISSFPALHFLQLLSTFNTFSLYNIFPTGMETSTRGISPPIGVLPKNLHLGLPTYNIPALYTIYLIHLYQCPILAGAELYTQDGMMQRLIQQRKLFPGPDFCKHGGINNEKVNLLPVSLHFLLEGLRVEGIGGEEIGLVKRSPISHGQATWLAQI